MSVLQCERQHNKHQVVAEGNKRVFLPHLSVVLTGVESPQRKAVEAYIATQFFKNHAAKVNSFLPFLLSAETKKNITSVIGFQLAEASKSLFVEQYLDNKAESVISCLLNDEVSRCEIAEIGNLTSNYPGASQMMFILLISILHQLNIDWALFTATRQVQSMIKKLNIECLDICKARRESLLASSGSWGSYYKNQPTVIAGNIKEAYAILDSHPVAGFMMANYQSTIEQLVLQISQNR